MSAVQSVAELEQGDAEVVRANIASLSEVIERNPPAMRQPTIREAQPMPGLASSARPWPISGAPSSSIPATRRP